ncbi:hypothetical protein NliqN6_4288 [Naganishia liquefaciens]|uniref:Transcription factor CBF/NF-Y/archaeal histone domain-containing protein n=1 Tax=Naganishia liquefaciens TaxID=104408 RepID=A0A8H3TUP1_9TREE|nr:hypothetical protein NliqN6_4288 [Naganishia liquefaciens]
MNQSGDRSSEGEDDNGISSNPLAHPFSNTLYNYGQHTSLPQPWQQASGLAISYPGSGLNGTISGDARQEKGSPAMYPDDDVLEREMALLEEEDPTMFLDGLMDPTTNGDLDSILPMDSAVAPSNNGKGAVPHPPTTMGSVNTSSAQPKQASAHTAVASSSTRPPPPQPPQPPQPHHHGYQPASLSSITGAKDRSLDQLLISFWTHQMDLAEKGTAANGTSQQDGQEPQQDEPDEFKTFGLPLARIKKVMKSDPDVKMISAEVPVLLSKACEIFIAELTCRAWLVAESHKRRTLQKSDVASAIGFSDMFDFLIDIVPREEAISKSELGMKRRTARMKEKKEEERKRKRQEELEEAYAYSQAQAHGQSGANSRATATPAIAPVSTTAAGLSQRIPDPAIQAGPSLASIGQAVRAAQGQQRENGLPAEKKRREE